MYRFELPVVHRGMTELSHTRELLHIFSKTGFFHVFSVPAVPSIHQATVFKRCPSHTTTGTFRASIVKTENRLQGTQTPTLTCDDDCILPFFLSSLDSREEPPATMTSEYTVGCALLMRLASVDVPVDLLRANNAPHGCVLPYLETSAEHRTEHFLMGGSNCCITFHTHELLFLFPVGGATIVTVARFHFLGPRASEGRVSHTEVVDLPCPPLSAQGAGESLLWLMLVTLSADPTPQNHVCL